MKRIRKISKIVIKNRTLVIILAYVNAVRLALQNPKSTILPLGVGERRQPFEVISTKCKERMERKVRR